jgi:hypothetical protein
MVIALSLGMASRVGLGAPLLERSLSKPERPVWLRSGLALTALMCIVAAPFSPFANRNIDPADYPFGWALRSKPGSSRKLATVFSGLPDSMVGRTFATQPESAGARGLLGRDRNQRTALRLGACRRPNFQSGGQRWGSGDGQTLAVFVGFLPWKLGLE